MARIDPGLKSGDAVGMREFGDAVGMTDFCLHSADAPLGIGPVKTNPVSRSSVVHPTTYVKQTFSSDNQTIDPVSPYVAPKSEIICRAQTINPISAYLAAREYEVTCLLHICVLNKTIYMICIFIVLLFWFCYSYLRWMNSLK